MQRIRPGAYRQLVRFVSTDATQTAASDIEEQVVRLKSRKEIEREQGLAELERTARERRIRKSVVDMFSQLGSTQNKKTTFQPHETISKPLSPVEVTQSHLIAAGAHLGHSKKVTHRTALSNVYGYRHGTAYVDSRATLAALRKAAVVVKETVQRGGIVLIVGTTPGTEKAIFANAQRMGRQGYGLTKWVGGTLTNMNEVFARALHAVPTGYNGYSLDELNARNWSHLIGQPAITPATLKPSLLITLNTTDLENAVREATINNIPTIGITDTDLDPRSVTYAIPANDDSPRAVELILGVLGMAGKEGWEGLQATLKKNAQKKYSNRQRQY